VPDLGHEQEEGEEHHRESGAETQRRQIDEAIGRIVEQREVDRRRRGAPRPGDEAAECDRAEAN
jgi:hypothetical protein